MAFEKTSGDRKLDLGVAAMRYGIKVLKTGLIPETRDKSRLFNLLPTGIEPTKPNFHKTTRPTPLKQIPPEEKEQKQLDLKVARQAASVHNNPRNQERQNTACDKPNSLLSSTIIAFNCP
ncbi:hypothetical protein YC2023_090400 [Brassica napus]